jgi:hypothetical protein
MGYTKRFYVLCGARESKLYLMNAALKLARRMRAKGCRGVTVCQLTRGG